MKRSFIFSSDNNPVNAAFTIETLETSGEYYYDTLSRVGWVAILTASINGTDFVATENSGPFFYTLINSGTIALNSITGNEQLSISAVYPTVDTGFTITFSNFISGLKSIRINVLYR